jgi:DNA ligase-1
MKKIKIFQPIESMNPLYLGSLEEELFKEILATHNGQTMAEVKEDGYRMQLHKKGDKIKAYTRSMNNILLELFPELHSSLNKLPNCILDCEIYGHGKKKDSVLE